MIYGRRSFNFLTLGVILALVACSRLSGDVYWRSGPYVLVAVDTLGQMNLAIDRGDGTSISLVGPTVFAVGANNNYIIVKQHPSENSFGKFDRSISNYYIVERTDKNSQSNRNERVLGPMSKAQFLRLATRLRLPHFSKTIADLE